MTTDERTTIEMRATLDTLRPMVHDLRTRGFDATLWVEQHDDHVTCEIRVRVPPLGVPIEVGGST